MQKEEVLLKVKPLLASYLEKAGYVLVDIRLYKNREGTLIFELLVDRVEGGITLDECARLNKELGGIVEHSGFMQGRYTLDVSSPGLDRPLMILSDFKRVIGKELRIFLNETVEEKIEYCGVIESVDEGSMTLRTQTKTIKIPLEKVNRAKQVIL